MNKLDGKVAIVTGAGSGIGRSSAMTMAAQGAKVVVVDIRGDAAMSVAQEITEVGGIAMPMTVDVGDEAQLKKMVDDTVSEYGSIDVLFNNALTTNANHIANDNDLLEFNADTFIHIMRVNVLGGVLAVKHALPYMLKQGKGSIIFTSSVSSLAGEINAYSYGASKAAVNWYVKTIAASYGKKGIRCNGIVPGVIVTPAQQAWSNDALDAAFLDILNVPRLGQPADIAKMAVFLASDDSEFCNGSLYEVTGGMNCATPMVPIVRKFLE